MDGRSFAVHGDLGVCLGAGIAVLLILELAKPLWRCRLTR
jgi:hypothetical protein